MVSYDVETCQTKLFDCEIEESFQPTFLNEDTENEGWWMCEDCKYGFLWRFGETGEPGYCQACSEAIPNCENCQT